MLLMCESEKQYCIKWQVIDLYEFDVIKHFGLKQTAYLFVSKIKNVGQRAVLRFYKDVTGNVIFIYLFFCFFKDKGWLELIRCSFYSATRLSVSQSVSQLSLFSSRFLYRWHGFHPTPTKMTPVPWHPILFVINFLLIFPFSLRQTDVASINLTIIATEKKEW